MASINAVFVLFSIVVASWIAWSVYQVWYVADYKTRYSETVVFFIETGLIVASVALILETAYLIIRSACLFYDVGVLKKNICQSACL
jgi:cell division protein YceG involved in septum cleavage